MIHSLLKHFRNHPLRKGSRIAVVGSWMLVKYVSFTQRWEIPLKWNRRFGIPRLTKWACFLIYFKPGCSRSRPWLHPLHSPNLDLFASRHVNPFKAFKRHKRHGSSSWQWCEFTALLSTTHWWLQKKTCMSKSLSTEKFFPSKGPLLWLPALLMLAHTMASPVAWIFMSWPCHWVPVVRCFFCLEWVVGFRYVFQWGWTPKIGLITNRCVSTNQPLDILEPVIQGFMVATSLGLRGVWPLPKRLACELRETCNTTQYWATLHGTHHSNSKVVSKMVSF